MAAAEGCPTEGCQIDKRMRPDVASGGSLAIAAVVGRADAIFATLPLFSKNHCTGAKTPVDLRDVNAPI
jgi:hypothetical protein